MNMKNSLSFIWCMCVKFSSWNQMNSEQRTFIQCAKFACIVHNQYNFISTTLFYIYIYYIHIQFNNVGTKGERERERGRAKEKETTPCVLWVSYWFSFRLDFLSRAFQIARRLRCFYRTCCYTITAILTVLQILLELERVLCAIILIPATVYITIQIPTVIYIKCDCEPHTNTQKSPTTIL